MTAGSVFRLLIVLLIVQPSFVLAQPDTIFYNGKIVTVDNAFSIAEAFAVRGDRIQSVGQNSQIRKLAGPVTVLVDLQGRTVIPGLCDSHVHAPAASLYEFDHLIPEMDTVADVLNYVAARAELLPGAIRHVGDTSGAASWYN